MNAIEVTRLLEEADEILLAYAIEHLCANEGEVAA